MTTKATRYYGIDVMKIFATLSVIVLHYSEYYFGNTDNFMVYILLNSFRWISFGCVGYFVLATGYLQCNKSYSKKHFVRIINLLLIYAIYCLLAAIFCHAYTGETSYLSFLFYAFKYCFFQFSGYFWYMSMFLGLYLFIPYINKALDLENKRQHQILILILVVFISLPSQVTQLADMVPWFKNSGIMLPTYYSSDLFPFLFYVIGAYIKKYSTPLSRKKFIYCIVILISSLLIHSILDWTILHLNSEQFQSGQHIYTFNQYGSVFSIISCTTIMLMMKDLRIHHNVMKKIISFLSSLTLEIYLGLMVTDVFVRKLAKSMNFSIDFSLSGFLFWTIFEFGISFAMAVVVRLLYNGILKLITVGKRAIG